MNQIPEEKFNKRRLISSYFSVVVSISLVLFLTGILGFCWSIEKSSGSLQGTDRDDNLCERRCQRNPT